MNYWELTKDETKAIKFLVTETDCNSSTPIIDLLYILDLNDFDTKNMNSIKLRIALTQVEVELNNG